ncbi:MAG TPA: hypothetical protein VMN38_04565 [Sphingomicrobium sp.]|nr:hypothetical protein [Sphingomicrobium sp.]
MANFRPTARVGAIAESAGENGGPGPSQVPLPDQQEAWPTGLLATAVSGSISDVCSTGG